MVAVTGGGEATRGVSGGVVVRCTAAEMQLGVPGADADGRLATECGAVGDYEGSADGALNVHELVASRTLHGVGVVHRSLFGDWGRLGLRVGCGTGRWSLLCADLGWCAASEPPEPDQAAEAGRDLGPGVDA